MEGKRKFLHSPGQALSEYGLIATIVALALVPVLTLFGNTLRAGLDHMLGVRSNPAPSAVTSASIATLTGPSSSNSAVPAVFLKTANGSTVPLLGYPANLKTLVETAGANGATSILSQTLNSLANRLLATKDLSQDQYNALMALSNQGHRIANIESGIEQALASGNPSYNTSFLANGQTYTLGAINLHGSMGISTNNNPTLVTDPLHDSRAVGETSTFLNLYQTALQSGAMQDPAVRQIVDSLSGQIAYLSEVSTSSIGLVVGGDLAPGNVNQWAVSATSHIASTGICTAGNGEDNGIQCN